MRARFNADQLVIMPVLCANGLGAVMVQDQDGSYLLTAAQARLFGAQLVRFADRAEQISAEVAAQPGAQCLVAMKIQGRA